MQWCNKDERCKKLQLTDLLVAPVQHIMKVPLILKEVETRTEDLNEKIVISQILEIEEKSIRKLLSCLTFEWITAQIEKNGIFSFFFFFGKNVLPVHKNNSS